MAVKVRQVRGVWRVVVDWKGRRASRNVGPGKEGRRAARLAAEQIQAKLVKGIGPSSTPPPRPSRFPSCRPSASTRRPG
jgi:hypothetical protein